MIAFPYDQVEYPGHPYDYTHPDRLATVAMLCGMQPAPLSGCRVLEIGCGDGANLIPIACQWPESEFVGLDLSSAAIARGQAMQADVGAGNVTLRQCDIMDVDGEFGNFDYIVAHGVFSWVPEAVRERLLAVLGERLNPNGVAYLSYNSLTGSHLRNLARDIMRYHVRAIRDAGERIAQARAILTVVADLSAADGAYGAALREQRKQVVEKDGQVLFHDELSDEHTAFLLADVVAAAERHGLQYLGDATVQRADLQHVSPAVRDLLERFPADEFVAREQYLDFIEGHSFRRSLFCRSGIPLDRATTPARLSGFYFAGHVTPEDPGLDPALPGTSRFKFASGTTAATDHCLSKAALLHLGIVWPAALRLDALIDGALGRLGAEGAAVAGHLAEEREALLDTLSTVCRAGVVELHLFPARLTTQIGPYPRASRLARRQAEKSSFVTNLRHGTVHLQDDIVRQFLCLVDGTRTISNMAAELGAALQAQGQETATVEQVERHLRLLAELALLEA